MTASSTPAPKILPRPTVPAEAEDFYLWLPLIIVVIFTCIMITLILIGRRAVESHDYRVALTGTHVYIHPNKTQFSLFRTVVSLVLTLEIGLVKACLNPCCTTLYTQVYLMSGQGHPMSIIV